MVKNIEIENKFLVSKPSFYSLLKHFNKNSKNLNKQTNYYLDTPNMDLFKKHNGALRIRRIGDKFEMTFKQKKGHKNLETTIKINAEALKKLTKDGSMIKGIAKVLKDFNIDPTSLKLIGKLVTYRLKIKYLGGELFFDKNVYNVTTDYEIEYESNNYKTGNTNMIKLFTSLGINDYQLSKPKVKRVLNL